MDAFVKKGWLKFFTYVPNARTSIAPDKFEFNPAYRE
jgi:hypothetical protein